VLLYDDEVLAKWLRRDDFNGGVIGDLATPSTATSTAASTSSGCAVFHHIRKSTT